jgi:hypothetical protein
MPWRTSNAKSLLPPPFAKSCMWSAKMFVQALRVEWQPDPESPRRIRGYGPIRVRSGVVDYSRVKNRFNRSHRISCVVRNHFCRHQETGNKKTAYLASGGRLMFPTGELFRYSHLRVTSSETLVSEKAPLRSPSPGCRVQFPEHLLMLIYCLVHLAENLNSIMPLMRVAAPGLRPCGFHA